MTDRATGSDPEGVNARMRNRFSLPSGAFWPEMTLPIKKKYEKMKKIN